MKYLISILLVFSSIHIFAQLQKCGLPNYYPRTTADSHTYWDSCGKVALRFKRSTSYSNTPKWYFQGTFVVSSTPHDTSYLVGSTLITASYEDIGCRLYNTTTQSFWDWTGYSWLNSKTINIDSLLYSNNRWLGKNTFADSLTAEKGLKSGGLIDTKGLNTEGSATSAAATLNGVQADRDTVVVYGNFTLNGAYGTVGFNCTSSDKDCIFPTTVGTTNWRFIIRKDDDSSNDLVCKTNSGTEFYRIKSKMTVIFKNINGTWKRQL